MITRMFRHMRSNAVAYLALFIALGGTSYAAIRLPRNSVGTAQLRRSAVTNEKLAAGSITPAKLRGKVIGGYVAHWAEIGADGAVERSSSQAHVTGIPPQGGYVVTWSDTFSTHCAALVTPVASSLILGPSTGFADARIAGAHPTSVFVDTYNAAGQPSPAAFSVAVIC